MVVPIKWFIIYMTFAWVLVKHCNLGTSDWQLYVLLGMIMLVTRSKFFDQCYKFQSLRAARRARLQKISEQARS